MAQSIFSQERIVMYVTSKEGLNQREEPSISGRKVGTLLYGERVLIYGKSNSRITIDGITDYWYSIQYDNKSWVFGGYLSKELPTDLPVVLGNWDDKNDSRQYYYFSPNYSYREGRKESDIGLGGKWKLTGSTLVITITSAMEDETIPPNEQRATNIQLTVIDRNNIILTYPNGEQAKLTRNDAKM
jgi:hypothetical protein